LNQVREPVTVICPACAADIEPLPIVYGYPSSELFNEAEAGRVQLGGCVISGEDPDYVCPSCDASLWDTARGLSDSPPMPKER
jgi:hypothetical protein